MCMPEYLYGLILIDSLEAKASRGATRSVEVAPRKRETIRSASREKIPASTARCWLSRAGWRMKQRSKMAPQL
jgi:hypothetical protein